MRMELCCQLCLIVSYIPVPALASSI